MGINGSRIYHVTTLTLRVLTIGTIFKLYSLSGVWPVFIIGNTEPLLTWLILIIICVSIELCVFFSQPLLSVRSLIIRLWRTWDQIRSVLFSFGKLSLTVSCCCNPLFPKKWQFRNSVCLSSLPAMSVLIVERTILDLNRYFSKWSPCSANVTSQMQGNENLLVFTNGVTSVSFFS